MSDLILTSFLYSLIGWVAIFLIAVFYLVYIQDLKKETKRVIVIVISTLTVTTLIVTLIRWWLQ